ncbi:MAG: outer membrane beta-barrel protein [Desulfuromonadales bacterium]|nr:outer membrane beta-barrel protein [Desulfuromonadales bacterium]
MRTILVVSAVLSFISLLVAAPVCAEEIQMAKVYRDYPGYINPAVCENPNLDKAAASESVAQQPEASAPTRQPSAPAVAPAAAPMTPASVKPVPVSAAAPAAPVSVKPTATPAAASAAPASINPPAAPAPKTEPVALRKTCSSASDGSPSAEAVKGPYLAVWGGLVITNDIEINNSVDMSIDDGYGIGVAVGYDFGPVRLEVEASHRESDGDKFETSVGDIDANEDLKVSTVLVNGYVDLATGGPLTPYLGAGAGYARAELDNVGEHDDVGVAQFAAGLLMAVSSQVAVDLGYRYLLPVSHSDFDVEQHTAMLGLQIRF